MKFVKLKLNLKRALLICVVAALLCVTAYAIFYRTVAAEPTLNFAANALTAECSVTAVSFDKPGDTKTITFTAKNSAGNAPLSYNIQIDGAGDLAPAVFATLDGQYLGALGEANGSYTLKPYFINDNSSRVHTLELALHIGVPTAKGKTCTVNISAQATSVDTSRTAFVKTKDEFNQLLIQSGAGALTQKNIILDADIVLDAAALNAVPAMTLAADDVVMLDLNGHSLTLPDGLLVNGGILLLHDSRSGGKILGGNISLADGNDKLIGTYLVPQVRRNAGIGMQNGEIRDLLGVFQYYKLTVTADGGLAAVSGGYQATATLKNHNGALTVNGTKIGVPIIGTAADAQVDAIENTYLSYLKPVNSDTTAYIGFDVYLPLRFREADCQVTWWSSNADAITDKGIFTPALEAQSATLVATYSLGGVQIVRSYELTIRGQTPEERMSFLLARINVLELTDREDPNQTQVENVIDYELLPTLGNYKNWTNDTDLDISAISYDIDVEYTDFLAVKDNIVAGKTGAYLCLTRRTVYTYAMLQISVDFIEKNSGGQATKTLVGNIPVLIDLESRVELTEMMNFVEQAAKGQSFYGAMTAATPGRSIELPMLYQEQPITYYIPNPSADTDTTVVADSVGIVGDLGKGSVMTGDGKYYSINTEGSLDVVNNQEYTNPNNTDNGGKLGVYDGISASIVWRDSKTQQEVAAGTIGAEPYFRLTLDPACMQTTEQLLYVVAYYNDFISGKTTMTVTESRSILSFAIPTALHNNADGFTQSAAFDYVKDMVETAVPSSTGNDYILIRRLTNPSVNTLDFSQCAALTSMSPSDLAGLKYFTQLTTLNFGGTVAAHTLQDMMNTVSGLGELRTLNLSYCNISDIEPLRKLTNLTELDLRGNGGLQNVTAVADLANTLMSLDLRDSGVIGNYRTYNEWALAYCYFKGLDRDGEGCTILIGDSVTPTAEEAASEPATQPLAEGTVIPPETQAVDLSAAAYAAKNIYTPNYWDDSDAVLREYKYLVYAAARVNEIGTIQGSYLWLPLRFIENDRAMSWIAEKNVAFDPNTSYYTKYSRPLFARSATLSSGNYTSVYEFKVTAGDEIIAGMAVESTDPQNSDAVITADKNSAAVKCTRYFFIKQLS